MSASKASGCRRRPSSRRDLNELSSAGVTRATRSASLPWAAMQCLRRVDVDEIFGALEAYADPCARAYPLAHAALTLSDHLLQDIPGVAMHQCGGPVMPLLAGGGIDAAGHGDEGARVMGRAPESAGQIGRQGGAVAGAELNPVALGLPQSSQHAGQWPCLLGQVGGVRLHGPAPCSVPIEVAVGVERDRSDLWREPMGGMAC